MDTQAPLAPTFTGGSATALAGKGEAGASVTVSNGASSLGTDTVGSNGTWNMSFIASATPRSFIATQTDKAGNTSLASGGQAQIGTTAANTLTGTAGDDLFIGGSGADTFWFDSISTQDIIADFAATGAAHDIINFHGNAVLNSYASVLSRTTTLGSAVVISADANHSLTLNNVNKANLTAADFTFA
jgi:serralysin